MGGFQHGTIRGVRWLARGAAQVAHGTLLDSGNTDFYTQDRARQVPGFRAVGVRETSGTGGRTILAFRLLVGSGHGSLTLMTQAVADVASDESVLMGLGPWLAAASDTGMSPGARWQADGSVVAQVEEVLTSRADRALTDLLDCHDLALRTDPRDGSGVKYDQVVARLLGMAVSSAALFPPVVIQVAGMPAHPDEATASAASTNAAVLARRLTTWASLLTCAMTHRALLSDDDVSVFAGPHLNVCPEIASRLT